MATAIREKPTLLAELPERLHHHAYVVRNQEVNRQFFEDLLGIPLVATWCEQHHNAWLGRDVAMCHTFSAWPMAVRLRSSRSATRRCTNR